ncbi:MAG: hypothetical protein AAGF01_09000 [Cyanobacteria bacterium P01_G01_bin.38]
MFLPLVVHETQIKAFNYHQQGSVYKATFFRSTLHKLVRLFDEDNRIAAYTLGYGLADQGDMVLITVGANGYKVWADVRSAIAPHPVEQPESSKSA